MTRDNIVRISAARDESQTFPSGLPTWAVPDAECQRIYRAPGLKTLRSWSSRAKIKQPVIPSLALSFSHRTRARLRFPLSTDAGWFERDWRRDDPVCRVRVRRLWKFANRLLLCHRFSEPTCPLRHRHDFSQQLGRHFPPSSSSSSSTSATALLLTVNPPCQLLAGPGLRHPLVHPAVLGRQLQWRGVLALLAAVQLLRRAAGAAHLLRGVRQRAGVRGRVAGKSPADHHQLPHRFPGCVRPATGHPGHALGGLPGGRTAKSHSQLSSRYVHPIVSFPEDWKKTALADILLSSRCWGNNAGQNNLCPAVQFTITFTMLFPSQSAKHTEPKNKDKYTCS